MIDKTQVDKLDKVVAKMWKDLCRKKDHNYI